MTQNLETFTTWAHKNGTMETATYSHLNKQWRGTAFSMRTYFAIKRNFAKTAFGLNINYSLDQVSDSLALDRPKPVAPGFLNQFSFERCGGDLLEDMLLNNLGWRIFSERIVETLMSSSNVEDLELLPLPENVLRLDNRLSSYRVLGVKREVFCVDESKSKILWGKLPNGRKHILSFRECVLNESNVPPKLDIFLLGEYPVFPVISSRLAMRISELHPTGFVFEHIRAEAPSNMQ